MPFLIMLESIALAEAQEIGTTKAAAKEDNQRTMLVARLSHRVAELYSVAHQQATKHIMCTAERFTKLAKMLHIKKLCFEALTHMHTASGSFDTAPGKALWHVKKAREVSLPGPRAS